MRLCLCQLLSEFVCMCTCVYVRLCLCVHGRGWCVCICVYLSVILCILCMCVSVIHVCLASTLLRILVDPTVIVICAGQCTFSLCLVCGILLGPRATPAQVLLAPVDTGTPRVMSKARMHYSYMEPAAATGGAGALGDSAAAAAGGTAAAVAGSTGGRGASASSRAPGSVRTRSGPRSDRSSGRLEPL